MQSWGNGRRKEWAWKDFIRMKPGIYTYKEESRNRRKVRSQWTERQKALGVPYRRIACRWGTEWPHQVT